MKEIFVSRFAAWAPGLSSRDDWNAWAAGKREIPAAADAPALEFTGALFRRRLSQISRMTIQVLHDVLPLREGVKIFLVSFRGEVTQQLKLNKTFVTENMMMPALFSLSIFNTPAALATIALKLTGARYTTVFPRGDSFAAGFASAAAPLADADETVLVYADELLPPEYSVLHPRAQPPLAFAAVLSAAQTPGAVSLPEARAQTPETFLKYLFSVQDSVTRNQP